MEQDQIIKYPLGTEKSIKLIEAENKIVFVVDIKSTKKEIKKAIEELLKAKIKTVNTHIRGSEKRAYVEFTKETPAIDIATNLGII